MEKEMVNHPKHYNKNKSGIECIDLVEMMSFNVGNAVKYLWRSDHKKNKIEDCKKALWYLEREHNKINRTCYNFFGILNSEKIISINEIINDYSPNVKEIIYNLYTFTFNDSTNLALLYNAIQALNNEIDILEKQN